LLVGTAEQDSRDFRFRGRLEGRKGIGVVTGVCRENYCHTEKDGI